MSIIASEEMRNELRNFSEVLATQDGTKMVSSLRKVIEVAKSEYLEPNDILELIQQAGLDGGENLRNFVEREFDAVSA